MTTQETVEVHLEELGQHSWLKALANTLGGSFGSAQYRFVAWWSRTYIHSGVTDNRRAE